LSGGAGGLEGVGDQGLAGNGSTAGTSFTAMLASGTNLKYDTPAGDQVDLRITGGGFMDDLLSGSGQGIALSVVGEVPHHTVLSGSVRGVRGRTGQAYLGSTISGLGSFGDVRVKLSSPLFRVGSYPFSSGSAVSKASVSQAILSEPATRSSSTRVFQRIHRPFHSFRH
jgi:hypothetical protein